MFAAPVCSNKDHPTTVCAKRSNGQFRCRYKFYSKICGWNHAPVGPFQPLHLPVRDVIIFLLFFEGGCPTKFIRDTLQLSRRQCRSLLNWVCHYASLYNYHEFCRSKQTWRAGATRVVWDETVLHKRPKYGKGRQRYSRPWWAAGVVEQKTDGKIICAFVHCLPLGQGRRKLNLLLPIRWLVIPGATICTDQLRTYTVLRENYNHGTVNHSREWTNRATGVSTNAVEGLWSQLKRTFRKQFVPYAISLTLCKFPNPVQIP